MIVERNKVRAANPAVFHLTNVSYTGLHYSWAWAVGGACKAHFVMLNEYAGHLCDGCSPAPSCFYGKACYAGWTYPEDSLGFLEATLANTVGASNDPVFVIQHYCVDGYSNAWWSGSQRAELYATLSRYNTAGLICGHTHSAAMYKWNGTDISDAGIDVYNVPSTQKEDANGYGEPPEFFAFSLEAAPGGGAALRVGHRVGYAWSSMLSNKTLACGA